MVSGSSPAAGCVRRACVRPALGAHCSISAAGTATPPDWAIHHAAARAPAPSARSQATLDLKVRSLGPDCNAARATR